MGWGRESSRDWLIPFLPNSSMGVQGTHGFKFKPGLLDPYKGICVKKDKTYFI